LAVRFDSSWVIEAPRMPLPLLMAAAPLGTSSDAGIELTPVGNTGSRSAWRTESGRIRRVVGVNKVGQVMRERGYIRRGQCYPAGQLSLHGKIELVERMDT